MNEFLSERTSKLYQALVAKTGKREKMKLCEWEALLDVLLGFYDICCNLDTQRRDKQVAIFAKRFGSQIEEIRNLRVSKNDFEMVKTIGRGHFGEVCVVSEKGTRDVYAMKILKKSSTLSNDNIAFYEEERDIMAFCSNDWLVSLKYAFQDFDNLYLVMEYLPGGDLLTLLNKYDDSLMEEDTARFYIAEISMAIHAVHVLGYVHRDVKPENILIDYTGHVKLGDFGSAARLINGRSVLCKMPVGTPEYISPEVLQSMNSGGGIYGCECDWWSLGVVCYEMLCGCLPFEADGVLQLYSQIMNFKNTLEFPDDVKLSDNTRNLIKGLLEDQKTRIKFNDLSQHPFFKSIDLTTLKSMTPPHIPQVKDPLDTSNFTEIKPIKQNNSKPTVPSLAMTLPFLGFTFTKNLSSGIDFLCQKSFINKSSAGSDHDDSCKESNKLNQVNVKLNETLELKNKELVECNKKLKKYEADIQILTNDNKQKDLDINEVKNKFSQLIDENNSIKNELFLILKNNKDVESNKSTIDLLTQAIQDERSNYALIFKENELLKSKIVSISNDLEITNKRYKDSENYWKEFERIQLKSQQELSVSNIELQDVLNKTICDYKEKLRVSLEENKLLRESTSNYQKEIESVKEKMVNEVEVGLISELEMKYNDERSNNNNLKNQLIEKDEIISLKDAELESNNIKLLQNQQNIKNLENILEQTNGKLKEVELSMNDLLIQNDILKTKFQYLVEDNIQYKISSEIDKRKFIDLNDTIIKAENALCEEKENNKQIVLHLQQQITNINNTVEMKNHEICTLSGHIDELNDKNKALSDEVSRIENEVTQLSSIISAQKTSNFKLSQEIEEANITISQLTYDNDDLNSRLNGQIASHKETVYKLEATIAQQTKLINFLHSEVPKKKGGKTAYDPISTARNTLLKTRVTTRVKERSVDQQLEVERNQTLKLNHEVIKLKEQLTELEGIIRIYEKSNNSKEIVKNVVNDGELVSLGSTVESNSSKIDHLWYPMNCKIANMCFVCYYPIAFGKPIVQCTNCRITCHADCKNDIPQFLCKFPDSLSDSYNLLNGCTISKYYNDLDTFKPTFPFVSYLCIPNKVGHNKFDWIRYKFELTTQELVIKGDNENEIICYFNFDKMTKKCKVLSSIHTSDIFFTPVTNSPFVFGIEVSYFEEPNFKVNANSLTKEQSSNEFNTILYVLCYSLDDKRTWVRTLNEIIGEEKNDVIIPRNVISISSIPVVSSIVAISNNYFIIGCSVGLMLYNATVNNIESCIVERYECHYLCYHNDILLGIYGDKHSLVRFKSPNNKSIIDNCSSKKVLFSLNNLSIDECFSVFILSSVNSKNIKTIVSKVNELLIFNLNDLVVSNLTKISTNEYIPTCTISLDENRILLCQDKIYVYDIKLGNRKEFLNISDNSLAFMIFGSSSKSNYPMNIFKLNRGINPEYIICFSEFGFVVDQKGCRISKGDIRWDDIPLSFDFYRDILYVSYNSKIEIRNFSVPSLDQLNQNTFVKYIYIMSPHICAGLYDSTVYFYNILPSDITKLQMYGISIERDITQRSPSHSMTHISTGIEITKVEHKSKSHIFYWNKK